MCHAPARLIDDRIPARDAVRGTPNSDVRPVGSRRNAADDRISTRGRATRDVSQLVVADGLLQAALAYDGSTMQGHGIRATLNAS